MCRGVKQGSLLSPNIFIIVIDSLLRSLNATHQGLSRLGLDVGSSAYANAIRVVSNSADAISRLGSCVNSFCSANLLKLNASSIFEIFVIPVLLYGCETWDSHAHTHDKTGEVPIRNRSSNTGYDSIYHADLAPLIGLLHDGLCSPSKVKLSCNTSNKL